MKSKIRTHCDLNVYRKAFDTEMKIFEASRKFPRDEIYSLTDQVTVHRDSTAGHREKMSWTGKTRSEGLAMAGRMVRNCWARASARAIL
jgi:23S rRNA-intervening sequence protein